MWRTVGYVIFRANLNTLVRAFEAVAPIAVCHCAHTKVLVASVFARFETASYGQVVTHKVLQLAEVTARQAANFCVLGGTLVHAIFVGTIVATISPIHVTLAAFGLLVNVLHVPTPALPFPLKAKIPERLLEFFPPCSWFYSIEDAARAMATFLVHLTSTIGLQISAYPASLPNIGIVTTCAVSLIFVAALVSIHWWLQSGAVTSVFALVLWPSPFSTIPTENCPVLSAHHPDVQKDLDFATSSCSRKSTIYTLILAIPKNT